MLETDVAVVGAGPAGLSSALHLAAEGFQVALLDKAVFPRPKACGEGIMPAGIPILRDLGILRAAEQEGRRFHGVRFATSRGAEADGRFPAGRHGIILPRERLDQLLLEKAKESPRITFLDGHRVARVEDNGGKSHHLFAEPAGGPGSGVPVEIAARWLLAADGIHSAAARLLGISRRLPRRRRFGLRARFDGVEGLGEFVEVFLMPGYEIYVAPHAGGGGAALIALLLDEPCLAAFEGKPREAFRAALGACGPLRERARRAARRTPILGLGPLGGTAERWEGKGWLLVGDAASSLDPITGEGIAMALRNGRLAARHVAAALRSNGSTPSMGVYTWKRRGLLLTKRLLERFMLGVSARPSLSDAVLATLRRRPAVFATLLSDC